MHSSRHVHKQTSRKCNRFKMGKTLCICKMAHLLCVRHASKESPDANVFHCDTLSRICVCFAVFNRGSFGNILLTRNLFHTPCSRSCATSKDQFCRRSPSHGLHCRFFLVFFSSFGTSGLLFCKKSCSVLSSDDKYQKAAKKCRINITIMPITGLLCRHTWSIQFHPNPTQYTWCGVYQQTTEG
jgi:hypothetical protein